jgi:lactose/L-arabinose transport system permease protein
MLGNIIVKFKEKLKLNTRTAPYYFLLPVIIVFCVFMIYPIINSFVLSFQEFKYGEYKFVGLKISADV